MYQPLLSEDKPKDSLEDSSSLFDQWLLNYLNPLFVTGQKRELQLEDLGIPSHKTRSRLLYEKFSKHWDVEKKKTLKKISLWNALFKTAGYGNLIYCIVLFLLYAGLSYGPVLILSQLVSYFEGNTSLTTLQLWVLAAFMFILPVTASILATRSNVIVVHMAVQFRNSLVAVIFRKSLRLSPASRQQQSTGKIINMFANDTKQIQNLLYIFNNLLVSPIQIVVTLFLIYREVGVVTFVGLGYMVLIAPMNGVIFGYLNTVRKKKVLETDKRVKLMNEILNGIRVIKYYAWEVAFKQKIDEIREIEVRFLKTIAYVIAFGFSIFFFATPIILPILIFYVYIQLGNELDASTAFTTIALFNMLQMPFAFLPLGIVQYLQSKVSIDRITTFLLVDELQDYVQISNVPQPGNVVIKITNANFGWVIASADDVNNPMARTSSKTQLLPEKVQKQDEETGVIIFNAGMHEVGINRAVHTLRSVNVEIKKGQLVAIVGAVGSGKSSFLNAILGEMYLQDDGSVRVSGSIAYCDQRPWILNATVEGNILFGSPEKDQIRFDKAIAAASMEDDLKILPAGINTEIGERGINLSGGQKARVALARAVYLNSDVYLLDDPLAAVDAHVGQQIFQGCIKGALSGKTRLLVTHHVHLLPECDQIIILENGVIKASGTYQELTHSGIDITAFVPAVAPIDEETKNAEGEKNLIATQTFTRERSNTARSDKPRSNSIRERINSGRDRSNSKLNVGSFSHEIPTLEDAPEEVDNAEDKPKDDVNGGLMTLEERATGDVGFSIYMYYIRSGGIYLALGVLFFLIMVQGFTLGANFYLTFWGQASNNQSDNGHPMSNATNLKYMQVFAALSVGGVICIVVRGVILAQAQLRASLTLHSNVLNRVLGAPVGFFDVTPIGRIVNRFSSDMTTVDENLSQSISQMTNSLFSCIGALVGIAIATNGTFLILMVPLSYIYYRIQEVFRKTNTAIARLESVSRSPLYADFSEALSGLNTIRAYREQGNFILKLEKALDSNTVPLILQMQAGYWLGIRLDFIGAFISFFVAALAVLCDTVLSTITGNDFISAGYLALGLTYSFSLTNYLKFCVRMIAQLEAQMNSVERIKYYIENVEQEQSVLEGGNKPNAGLIKNASGKGLNADEDDKFRSKKMSSTTTSFSAGNISDNWPMYGKVEARNVQMRYRDGPLILRGLSFKVMPGEKIGVAGRTGSGKSSLMNALFRVQELAGGQMLIDDIDTATVPLHILRSRLGIIPQDPVMFSATVRFNLDPFNTHSDQEVWDILESVDMKNHVLSLPNKLNEDVAEGGDNFSAGQRQLICIGRALLRRPKILVLDEATASIDNETDNLIQKVVRNIFKGSTVLTIAHRLNTIIDSNRIMVLDTGKLAEMGSPKELLDNPKGMFRSLWDKHQQSHHEK